MLNHFQAGYITAIKLAWNNGRIGFQWLNLAPKSARVYFTSQLPLDLATCFCDPIQSPFSRANPLIKPGMRDMSRFRKPFPRPVSQKDNCLKSSPRVYCKIGYFFCQTAKRCTSSLSRGAFRVSSSLSHDRKKRARKGRVVVAKVHHEWYHLHHHHLDLAAFHKLFFLVVHSQFRGQSRYYNYVRQKGRVSKGKKG